MEGFYEPRSYRIRLKGHLDKNWSDWFEGMAFSYEGDSTILEGDIADNSLLHSILTRIHDLNLTILSLEHIQVNSSDHTNQT
jgi:hypothetical protein